MRHILVTLFLVLIIAVSCNTTKQIPQPDISIYPFSDTVRVTPNALLYALPMTVFEIEVTLVRTIRRPGPYADFSESLLGVTDIIRNESEEWTIEELSLKSHEEIDPSQYYIIKTDRILHSNSLLLNKYGLLLNINEAGVKARKPYFNEGEELKAELQYTDLGSLTYSRVDQEVRYRRVDLDTAVIMVPYPVENRVQLSKSELAERAAKILLELREGRHLILIGEATIYPQSDAPLSEIRRLEDEYLSLFIGKTWQEQVKMTLYHVPSESDEDEIPLFRLSDIRGVVAEDQETGEDVTIRITPSGKTLPLFLSGDIRLLSGSVSEGLTYRVPEVAEVIIRHGETKLLTTRQIIHQLGQKVVMPSNYLLER